MLAFPLAQEPVLVTLLHSMHSDHLSNAANNFGPKGDRIPLCGCHQKCLICGVMDGHLTVIA